MAALDSSLFAANRQGVNDLQSKLGGMQEQGRLKQNTLEGLDESLKATADTTGQGIAETVKKAVRDRAGVLGTNLGTSEAEKQSGRESADFSKAQGGVTDLLNEFLVANGIDPTEFAQSGTPFDSRPFITTADKEVSYAPSQDIINLASVLGVKPEELAPEGGFKLPGKEYQIKPTNINSAFDDALTAYYAKTGKQNPKLMPIQPQPTVVTPEMQQQGIVPPLQETPQPTPAQLPAEALGGNLVPNLNPTPSGNVVEISAPISYNPGPSVPPPPLPVGATNNAPNFPTVQTVDPFASIFRYPW
jgi:hypothetical protein